MEKIRKSADLSDIGNDARRQYIDAQATFTAWEEATRRAAEVRGGMYWKQQGKAEYLIRTSPRNSQKSLGPRSDKTEAIFTKFTSTKGELETRRDQLSKALIQHQRLNRALFVGRAPQILVEILNTLAKFGLAEHFMVIGTHALYAYEAAAGIRFEATEALATRDVDLLWDTRKRIRFITKMEKLGSSMIGMLQKVDKTFEIRDEQRYTAVNSSGFEVDIIRREASEGDPHPLLLTGDENDFRVVQAKRAGILLNSPSFSAMIVSPSGHMARMNTVSPLVFAQFKRWMADQPNREAMKVDRDRLQAELVEQLVEEYLPHLARDKTAGERADALQS
ncbi:MAG: GSU2403 family nucleotidyltransferase fold protein [Sulfuricella sp.]